VVAVLVEPVLGEGGVVVPADDYLPRVRALCDRYDWLMMLDEIQTGMGRTGRWFAHQHADVVPDVMTLAKALGNGVPIGACLARGRAAEALKPGSHGSTFGGNPLACSAALAVLETMQAEELVRQAQEKGERLENRLVEAFRGLNCVREVRGKGLMVGIELDRSCTELVGRALDRHLLINVAADKVIRLLPPLVISDDEIDRIVDTLRELVTEWNAGA
jgi:acetylornithine aminotransferase